jgi:hypothetical protein
MDLNELLRQHQIALINAENASPEGPNLGFRMVEHYERRISRLRTQLGVRQY